MEGIERKSYSAAVIEGVRKRARVFVGDSIVRKTDRVLNKGDDVVVCLPGAKIEAITEKVKNIVGSVRVSVTGGTYMCLPYSTRLGNWWNVYVPAIQYASRLPLNNFHGPTSAAELSQCLAKAPWLQKLHENVNMTANGKHNRRLNPHRRRRVTVHPGLGVNDKSRGAEARPTMSARRVQDLYTGVLAATSCPPPGRDTPTEARAVITPINDQTPSTQISLRLLSQSVAKSHARRRDTHYTLPRSPRSQPADHRRSIMQRCDPTMSKSQEFRSHDVTYEMCPL
ncbi:hypothetical protein LSAT2_007309 [Lamellibrachia satsuma]|nr:hypothetical protein LSAT2_007309 [Lamellibrachia satsuma]